jgi:hypothetical protein
MEGQAFLYSAFCILFSDKHTSRDLSLTAKIPDVFEAKLVFSGQKTDDGRRNTEVKTSVFGFLHQVF